MKSMFILVLALLVSPVLAAEAQYGSYRYDAGPRNNLDINGMIGLVNNARAQAQLGPVVMDTRLNCAAQRQCAQIKNTGEFEHTIGSSTVSTRMESCGFDWSANAENLYKDHSLVDTAKAHNAWMTSPGHRRNILNSKTDRIGLAVCADGNTLYWVQVFGQSAVQNDQQYLVRPTSQPAPARVSNNLTADRTLPDKPIPTTRPVVAQNQLRTTVDRPSSSANLPPPKAYSVKSLEPSSVPMTIYRRPKKCHFKNSSMH